MLTILKFATWFLCDENKAPSLEREICCFQEISGVYFFGGEGRILNSSGLTYNTKLAKELWNASSDLFLEASLASKETSSSDNLLEE